MKAAVIGGGVIGAGWAARFLVFGWDVALWDANDAVVPAVQRTLVNARQALHEIFTDRLPREGTLSFARSLEHALEDVQWVCESVPEVLPMKHDLYAQVLPRVAQTVPIASSTSGFKPSELARHGSGKTQILVCHPFNPVYLLPAVEVVGSAQTAPGIRQFCVDTLKKIGMQPIEVRREIEAHIADRLLESMWREALWLVRDGVATTQEIDDVIRYGFGLRWAQMGLFETYRIAGGDAGMPHFLAQFGPALQWPWSRLTDVPELTANLIGKITAQSDAQTAGRSVDDLLAQRDRNLVAICKALMTTNDGVGRLLNDFNRGAGEGLHASDPADSSASPDAPLRC